MLTKLISAQGNLVPNPSFELNTGCPSGNGQFYLVVDWENPTNGSPEYFDSCGAPIVHVPNNYWGLQIPFDGSSYAGLTVYYGNYYEYIQTKLSDTLIKDQTYCVSYYISRSGHYYHASIAPQVYFSQDSISSSNFLRLNYNPQIINWNIIYDTTNWVLITGEYLASGGERYLTLGNFLDSLNTPIDSTVTNPPSNPGSYYFVDNVSVYLKIDAKAGQGQTICIGDSVQIGTFQFDQIIYSWNTSLQLSDSTISNPVVKPQITTTYYLTVSDTGFQYCPGNPVDSVTIFVEDCRVFTIPSLIQIGEVLQIDSLPDNSKLALYDARGRLVFRSEDYQNDFNTFLLSAGIYFYSFEFPDGRKQGGKICLVR